MPRPSSSKSVRDLFDLTGHTAIVSGGSVGLGRQMGEPLAEVGANLVLCARKKERCVRAAEELQTLGVKTLALACDVKNPADIHAIRRLRFRDRPRPRSRRRPIRIAPT